MHQVLGPSCVTPLELVDELAKGDTVAPSSHGPPALVTRLGGTQTSDMSEGISRAIDSWSRPTGPIAAFDLALGESDLAVSQQSTIWLEQLHPKLGRFWEYGRSVDSIESVGPADVAAWLEARLPDGSCLHHDSRVCPRVRIGPQHSRGRYVPDLAVPWESVP